MMKRIFQKSVILFVIYFISQVNSFSQEKPDYRNLVNIIPTAVPFLSISPDSRSGGMGGVGVAISPDFNSQFWNPAKYAFIDKDFGIGLGFTPWLRHLIGDINLFSLSGFYRIDDMQGLSASLRYFSIGAITIRESGDANAPVYDVSPNEFAIDLAYNRVLSDYFSGSVAFRYIRSDLNSGINTLNAEAGNSFAADVAFYYHTPIKLGGYDSQLSAGVNVSNIGSKMSYDGGTTREFIPTNLGLGVAVETEMDAYNTITFSLDANKLLVPTPGLTEEDNYDEYRQRYNDTGTLKGMFQSFSDAPRGFKEEMEEINLCFGAEYWYDKQFAVRAGYYHEHKNKGNRKHFTAGIGLKFNILTLDASYIIAVNQNNPLANTIRFSLGVDIK